MLVDTPWLMWMDTARKVISSLAMLMPGSNSCWSAHSGASVRDTTTVLYFENTSCSCRCVSLALHQLQRSSSSFFSSLSHTHEDYLVGGMLPSTHPLFSTALFRDPQLLPALKQLVECRIPRPTDRIRATGLSPTTAVLQQLASVNEELQVLKELVTKIAPNLSDAVIKILEGALHSGQHCNTYRSSGDPCYTL